MTEQHISTDDFIILNHDITHLTSLISQLHSIIDMQNERIDTISSNINHIDTSLNHININLQQSDSGSTFKNYILPSIGLVASHVPMVMLFGFKTISVTTFGLFLIYKLLS